MPLFRAVTLSDGAGREADRAAASIGVVELGPPPARVALGLSVNPVHAGSLVIAREAQGADEPVFDSHKEQENRTNPATGVCRAES